MSKNPPVVLPFVNWPGATPKDRAALLTFWTNVILAAIHQGHVQPKPEPGLFLEWKKSARGNYWVKGGDTHAVVFKRPDHSWGARIQRDGCRAKYLKTTSDYPHFLLAAIETAFGKPRDLDNRRALVDFTIEDFDKALARDPPLQAMRLMFDCRRETRVEAQRWVEANAHTVTP
jgi:hypothetical protein